MTFTGTWVILPLIVACANACASPVFPKELFTVNASDADYPVMVSQTPATTKRSRPLTAQSGTRAAESQRTYYLGGSAVTVVNSTASASELPASVQLTGQVKRSDRWVQLERSIFSASNMTTYGSSAQDRVLIIDASAHR